jgi:hypothetical protein
VNEPADLQAIYGMASTIHDFYLALQEAGFSQQEALMLLPPLSVPVLFHLEKRRET